MGLHNPWQCNGCFVNGDLATFSHAPAPLRLQLIEDYADFKNAATV